MRFINLSVNFMITYFLVVFSESESNFKSCSLKSRIVKNLVNGCSKTDGVDGSVQEFCDSVLENLGPKIRPKRLATSFNDSTDLSIQSFLEQFLHYHGIDSVTVVIHIDDIQGI